MTRKVLYMPARAVAPQPEPETQRRVIDGQPAMVPLSRVQALSAKNRALKSDILHLRDAVVALYSNFLIMNDKGRRKLGSMGASRPEDILPLLLTADGAKRTEIFAVIANATKDGDE